MSETNSTFNKNVSEYIINNDVNCIVNGASKFSNLNDQETTKICLEDKVDFNNEKHYDKAKNDIFIEKKEGRKIDGTTNNKFEELEIIFTKESKIINLLKKFLFNLCKFSGIRAIIGLIKLILKLKFSLNKINIKNFMDNLYNTANIRTGLFLSLMPFIYELFTDIIFDVKKNNYKKSDTLHNNIEDGNNHSGNFEKDRLREKIIVLLSGFLAAFVGILFVEKGVKIMNYIILSILIRSIHSLIVVYLSKRGFKTQSHFWGFMAFYLACFGFLFIVYFNPDYKPIFKLYSRYGNFEGSEKEEFRSIINKTNLF